MSKLVSICIPTYKQTQYLEKCLDSVLQQDFKDFELIISDDTPDDSVEVFVRNVLKEFPYSYTRNTPALGMPENWNSAISKAQGMYIKIMHHDDFFTQPDSLKKMVAEIERQKADFLFCQTDVWDVKNNTHRVHQISDKQLALTKKRPEFLFFKNMIGAPSTTLYLNNKSVTYDKQFKWLVDIDVYMQALFQGKKIAYLPAPLISTAHDTEGQVTTSVINDKGVQIREHVLLYNKIKGRVSSTNGFASFFDYLFDTYNIRTFDDLVVIVPEANNQKSFYENVISGLASNRAWKRFKKRFFESRYNNYIFRSEQFI